MFALFLRLELHVSSAIEASSPSPLSLLEFSGFPLSLRRLQQQAAQSRTRDLPHQFPQSTFSLILFECLISDFELIMLLKRFSQARNLKTQGINEFAILLLTAK
jgi:hypothetical protein